MLEPSDVGAGALAPSPQRVAFVRRRGLFWLLMRNLLLNVVSLSFYRFWARTAVRRFYWGSVTFAGEPLEFTGRGLDLFIGFLIALAVLAPLGFAFSAVDGMLGTDRLAHATVQTAYFFVLFVLTLVARFRARRYRLSRTSWRAIRFAVDGATLRYVAISLGWWLAVLLTLGIATPWKRAAQRAYLTRSTTFGDRRFAFEPRPATLLPRWLLVLALTLVPIAAVLALNASAIAALVPQLLTDQPIRLRIPQIEGLGLVAIPPTAGFAAYVFYRVAELRMFTASTTLDQVRFASTVGAPGILWRVAVLALLTVASALVLLRAMSLLLPAVLVGESVAALILASLIGFGAWAAAMYLLYNGWLRRAIVAAYFNSVAIASAGMLDTIGQSRHAAPTRGEGLADSLEFGAD